MTNKQKAAIQEALDQCCHDAGVFGEYHDLKDFLKSLRDAGYTVCIKKAKR